MSDEKKKPFSDQLIKFVENSYIPLTILFITMIYFALLYEFLRWLIIVPVLKVLF